jgi:hypothetical protein
LLKREAAYGTNSYKHITLIAYYYEESKVAIRRIVASKDTNKASYQQQQQQRSTVLFSLVNASSVFYTIYIYIATIHLAGLEKVTHS